MPTKSKKRREKNEKRAPKIKEFIGRPSETSRGGTPLPPPPPDRDEEERELRKSKSANIREQKLLIEQTFDRQESVRRNFDLWKKTEKRLSLMADGTKRSSGGSPAVRPKPSIAPSERLSKRESIWSKFDSLEQKSEDEEEMKKAVDEEEEDDDIGKRMDMMEQHLVKATAAYAEAARQRDYVLGSPHDSDKSLESQPSSLRSPKSRGLPKKGVAPSIGAAAPAAAAAAAPSAGATNEESTLLDSGPASPLDVRVPDSASLVSAGASSVASREASYVGGSESQIEPVNKGGGGGGGGLLPSQLKRRPETGKKPTETGDETGKEIGNPAPSRESDLTTMSPNAGLSSPGISRLAVDDYSNDFENEDENDNSPSPMNTMNTMKKARGRKKTLSYESSVGSRASASAASDPKQKGTSIADDETILSIGFSDSLLLSSGRSWDTKSSEMK